MQDKTEPFHTFSERLRKLMQEKHFNASSLGKACGVAHTTVNRWLDGSEPKSGQLDGIARALGVSVQFLMEGKTENPDWEKLLVRVVRKNPGSALDLLEDVMGALRNAEGREKATLVDQADCLIKIFRELKGESEWATANSSMG